MEKLADKQKFLVYTILFIAWLAICTGVLIYFLVILITENLIPIVQNLLTTEFAEDYPLLKRGVMQIIFYIFFSCILYGSFVALAVPKIIKFIRPLCDKNDGDEQR